MRKNAYMHIFYKHALIKYHIVVEIFWPKHTDIGSGLLRTWTENSKVLGLKSIHDSDGGFCGVGVGGGWKWKNKWKERQMDKYLFWPQQLFVQGSVEYEWVYFCTANKAAKLPIASFFQSLIISWAFCQLYNNVSYILNPNEYIDLIAGINY